MTSATPINKRVAVMPAKARTAAPAAAPVPTPAPPVFEPLEGLPATPVASQVPTALSVNLDNIPDELKSLRRWVCWAYEDGRKLPKIAGSSSNASSTKPDTWTSFEQAARAYDTGRYSGIGIVLDGDGLVGVDLDKCVVNGVPDPAALAHMASVGCEYVELSPSGTGLRGLGYASNLTSGKKGIVDGVNVELYSSDRYLTLTGHVLRNGPLVQLPGFHALADRVVAAKESAKTAPSAPSAPSAPTPHVSANERGHMWAQAALDGAVGDVASAGAGGRNNTLNDNALRLFRITLGGLLDEGVVQQRLEAAGVAAGLPRSEVLATLRSARAGARKEGPVHAPKPTEKPRHQPARTWQADEDGVILDEDVDADDDGPVLVPVDVLGVFDAPSEPPKFIWGEYLPRATTTLFGAHGGTGKSTIGLMMAVAVATGKPLFGIPTVAAPAVFVSLEDGAGVVRHRLAKVCKWLDVDPRQLGGRLFIVDGTENPELFTADNRNAGGTLTRAYSEVRALARDNCAGLVVIDNASDAYGGDEIVRRQVRAFIRSLNMVAKEADAAVVLLAHVDKGTSRNNRPDNGEGYSGSTAWHNSVRSRLFLSRDSAGLLTLAHQKTNHGRMQDPLTLVWLEGELPKVAGHVGADVDYSELNDAVDARQQDTDAAVVLRMVAEFEGRGQYASPAPTARNNVFALLRGEPLFKRLKIDRATTQAIVNQCQRAGWLEVLDYRTKDRKDRDRWTVTDKGREWVGLASAPTAPTAPTYEDGAHGADGADGGAPTAPTS